VAIFSDAGFRFETAKGLLATDVDLEDHGCSLPEAVLESAIMLEVGPRFCVDTFCTLLCIFFAHDD